MYKENAALMEAIRIKLGELLGTENPGFLIALLVENRAFEFPDLDVEKDYSVIEDVVVRHIIAKTGDKELEALWYSHNIGFFMEDTVRHLLSKGA